MAAPLLRTRWSVKFNVISSTNDRHPLHLCVGKGSFNSILGSSDDTNVIIALERCNGTRTSRGGRLFAVLLQVDLDTQRQSGGTGPDGDEDAESETTSLDESVYKEVAVHCTDHFLSHYGFKSDDDVYFTVPHSVALDKVVVGVSSKKAFAWVKTVLFSRGLLLSVCQGKVLIRQNDNLLVPCSSLFTQDDEFSNDLFFDMKVLYCEPVCQGRLSVTTEIIIMNQVTDTRMLDQNVEISPVSQNDSQRKPAKSKAQLNLKTVDNLSSVVEPSAKKQLASDCPGEGNLLCKTKLTVLELQEIVSKEDFVEYLWSSSQKSPNFDELNTVGVSKSCLEGIGLEDGDIAEMFLYRPTQDKKHEDDEFDVKPKKDDIKDKNKESTLKTKRMVILKQLKETTCTEHVASVSPCLRFNLCKKTSYTNDNQVCLKKPPETLKEVSPDELLDYASGWHWHGGIPYAAEIHISLVRSPTYATCTDASQMLRDYFSKPRLIKKGDVLALSSKSDGDFCNELPDGQRYPVVYFRVIRVHPSLPAIHTYWADIERTVLFQDGALNHYIPGWMPMFLHEERSVLPPPGLTNVFEKLKSVIRPHFTHKRRTTDPVPTVLLTGSVGCGKRVLSQAVAAALNLHVHVVNTFDLCGETSAAAEARVKALMTRVTSFAPCVLLLRNIHAFGKGADGNTEDPRTASSFHEIIRTSLADQNKHPVILLASTSVPKQVNADMYEGFLHQIDVQAPTESERREMVSSITGNTRTCCNINKSRIAQRTAGFVLGDIYALVSHAHKAAEARIKRKCLTACHPGQRWNEEEDLVMAGVSVCQQDFEAALDKLQAAHSDSIGAPKIPKVSWADVGGLASVKADILDTIQLPLQHPELLAAGLRRSGVLLYGPPGTGKTLLAKAVATECSLNFMSVKGPELINMYVGQSEENIREVFHRARSAAPCVIFFDELDSLAPNRGRSGDSGGVMDRVVSQLLAELDGMSKSSDVFVIGATNRPDLLDPALLRPGRFDKLLYLGVSKDKQGQLKILNALTRKFQLTPGWSLSSVVEGCPSNMTGADFYALCSDAMLNALKRKISLLEQGIDVDQDKIEVDIEDFKQAVASLVPSVSEAELEHYKYIQRQFNGGKS